MESNKFVEKQFNHKTVKETNLDVKKFLRFLQDEPYSEKRSLCELLPFSVRDLEARHCFFHLIHGIKELCSAF